MSLPAQFMSGQSGPPEILQILPMATPGLTMRTRQIKSTYCTLNQLQVCNMLSFEICFPFAVTDQMFMTGITVPVALYQPFGLQDCSHQETSDVSDNK